MADSDHERYFTNELRTGGVLDGLSGTFTQATRNQLYQLLESLLDTISNSPIVTEKQDMSVYTGRAGLAFLYFHLYKTQCQANYLDEALEHILYCNKKLKGKRVTFLCGDPGVLALSAVIFNELPNYKSKVSTYLTDLLEFLPKITDLKKSSIPDEILYGRAGYLYSLLFVNKHIHGAIEDDVIVQVWMSILDMGIKNATKEESPCPLMYEWHSKKYIGAAHGLSGILNTMLQVDHKGISPYIKSHVKPTIDYILSLQFPSGNFPSSLGSERDKLVHWCHGAPGVIHLMLAAYQTFKEPQYLQSAEKCCNVIWEKGLLRKGYGLCHGIAGNAYALLAMFHQTKNIEYLNKATRFALWCADYKTRRGLNTPDEPYSVFEGFGGTALFVNDMLHDHGCAKFPGFVL